MRISLIFFPTARHLEINSYEAKVCLEREQVAGSDEAARDQIDIGCDRWVARQHLLNSSAVQRNVSKMFKRSDKSFESQQPQWAVDLHCNSGFHSPG